MSLRNIDWQMPRLLLPPTSGRLLHKLPINLTLSIPQAAVAAARRRPCAEGAAWAVGDGSLEGVNCVLSNPILKGRALPTCRIPIMTEFSVQIDGTDTRRPLSIPSN